MGSFAFLKPIVMFGRVRGEHLGGRGMRSAIHLPVVERLRVLNYPLYPGSSRQGLDLSFDRGVTVIAGINGIGKTTLLNLLLRMLVGPG